MLGNEAVKHFTSDVLFMLCLKVPDSTNGEHGSLKNSLEELLKLMLIVWCKENNAIKTVSGKANGNLQLITKFRII